MYGVPGSSQVLGHGGHAAIGSGELRIELGGFLEGVEGLLELARELLLDAESVFVDGFERCGGKSSADFAKLHRSGRDVAQCLTNGSGEFGEAAENVLLIGDGHL
jgi:hypothetical protein